MYDSGNIHSSIQLDTCNHTMHKQPLASKRKKTRLSQNATALNEHSLANSMHN